MSKPNTPKRSKAVSPPPRYIDRSKLTVAAKRLAGKAGEGSVPFMVITMPDDRHVRLMSESTSGVQSVLLESLMTGSDEFRDTVKAAMKIYRLRTSWWRRTLVVIWSKISNLWKRKPKQKE